MPSERGKTMAEMGGLCEERQGDNGRENECERWGLEEMSVMGKEGNQE